MKTIFEIILLAFLLVLITTYIFYKIPVNHYDFQASLVLSLNKERNLNKEREILKKLSLDEKIGQLFIIGIEGKTLTPKTEELIKKLRPGGILLLEKNIENEKQLKKLISSLQKTALNNLGLPLFIAVDQEGGEISRIKWLKDIAQSEIENENQAYSIGKKRGERLRELGINFNLAPVLDITSSGDFIHQRSFQKGPKRAGELAEFLIRGQKDAGISTAIKHFPGYQGISFNPEEKLAILEKVPEISQFQRAMEEKPEAIVVSNVVYKELDEKLPFAFSEKGIQFLKNKLKGDYLIVSDDLAQASLLNEFSLREIVVLPVKSGTDVLIFSGHRIEPEKGVFALKEAVENREISQERINQSVLKIIKLKNRIISF